MQELAAGCLPILRTPIAPEGAILTAVEVGTMAATTVVEEAETMAATTVMAEAGTMAATAVVAADR
jgi:hypothetical protein